MTDPPDDREPGVASWLIEQLDHPEHVDHPDNLDREAAPDDDAPDPPVGVGAATRLGCAVLELVLFVCCLGVGWVVWWIALWPRGGTPARSILHLAAVRPDGTGVPPAWRIGARELSSKVLLPLAPVSALVWIAGRRGLWDRMTGTIVAEVAS